MPTQEVEGYLERIQYQNKILDDWEQSRKQLKRQSQSQSQSSQKQQQRTAVNDNTGAAHSKPGGAISAMGKLMKNWITTGSSQQSQDRKPAARSLSAMIDAEMVDKRRGCHDGQFDDKDEDDEDEDDESQTQMPPSGFMDSPDLLALPSGYAMPYLNAFNRTGVIGRVGGGLEDVVSRATSKKPIASRKPTAARQVIAAPPPRRSSGGTSRKRAVTTVSSSQSQPDEDEEMKESSVMTKEEDDGEDEMGNSQASPPTGRRHFDQFSRSSTVLKASSAAHAGFLESRKKQRVSEDFGGAITAFRSQQQQPKSQQHQPPVSVQPVARLGSFTSISRGILNGGPSALYGRSGITTGASSTESAAAGAGLLSPQSLSRPPLSSSARQLAAEIRLSNSFTLVATDLTNAECKRISTACSLLGGRFGLRFDFRPDPETGVLCSSVTHLIAKSVKPGERRCKRTAKYMRALAEGCFVMDYSWVEASLEAGKWVREDDHEMLGDAYSDSVGKPHESHVQRLRIGRRNELFQRFRFILLCDEAEFDYQIETLRSVVENFGATVISTSHYKRLGPEKRAQKTQVGIVGKSTAPTDAKHQWEQFQIPIVRVAWLFDCISHLEVLSYNEYYPY